MDQPRVQHVELEWDFYPGRQDRGCWEARRPQQEGTQWPQEEARDGRGHYLCKSPSLASKKFTVYLTDLAIRIRMSNVSWERPQT